MTTCTALNLRLRVVEMGVLAMLIAPQAARGHVLLDTPNGGEVLTAGSTFTIEWRVLVGHDTLGWDLWYSTTGEAGPWIDLAISLPPGEISTGSLHTYDWLVPEVATQDARVRVRQHNERDPDYFDHSNSSFTISSPNTLPGDFNGDGLVDAADYVAWRDGLGKHFAPEQLGEWKSGFGTALGAGGARAATGVAVIPEPASVWLLLVGLWGVYALHRRR